MRTYLVPVLCLLLLAACGQQPAVTDEMRQVDVHLPVDYSGSWQRNYARDDEVVNVLNRTYYELARASTDPYGAPAVSQQDGEALLAMAQLAELITRFDIMTIVQNDREIRVQRKDDFSMVCRFQDGAAQTVENAAGAEICGWIGKDLVSQMTLADGLEIVNRFTMSEDGEELRVVTTVSSSGSRVPFSLRRFYHKFDQPKSDFHCIETLTMKRVCSTKAIEE